MFFFLILISLVLSDIFNFNNTSPPLVSKCDAILCENTTIDQFTNNATRYTFHHVAKYITSKNYTGIMEYKGWVGDNTTLEMDLLDYIIQMSPFFKLTYDYDSMAICKSNHDIIMYTYILTIGFTYDYDEAVHTDGISLNVNNSNLYATLKYNSKISMYNNTSFESHSMVCNQNLTYNWNEPKIFNYCVLDDNKVMYTELISEKVRSNC